MIKKFCDSCGEELMEEYSCFLSIKHGPGFKCEKGDEHLDLCLDCKFEMDIFIKEQCKYHILRSTERAFDKLEL